MFKHLVGLGSAVLLFAIALAGCAGSGEVEMDGHADDVAIDATDHDAIQANEAEHELFVRFLPEYPKLNQLSAVMPAVGAYAMHLHHAGEPALKSDDLAPGQTVIRMIIMDAGARDSTIIRITKADDGVTVVTKEFDAHGLYTGENNGELEKTPPRTLTDAQWVSLWELVEKADVMKLDPANPVLALDASHVLLEIVTPTAHQVVERHLGIDRGVFHDLTMHIWRVSGAFMGVWESE